MAFVGSTHFNDNEDQANYHEKNICNRPLISSYTIPALQ